VHHAVRRESPDPKPEAQLGVELFERRGVGCGSPAPDRPAAPCGCHIPSTSTRQSGSAGLPATDAAAAHVPSFFASELLLAALPELCSEHNDISLEIAAQSNGLAEHGWDSDISVIVAASRRRKLQSLLLFPQASCRPAVPNCCAALQSIRKPKFWNEF